MLLLLKTHPVEQGAEIKSKELHKRLVLNAQAARDRERMLILLAPGEPTPAEAEADTYNKPLVQWQGLTIAIENPAGSVRRGMNREGIAWEVRMPYDYGEVVGTCGVDGDPVDVFLGVNLEAPMVYVVHQRKVNRWDQYDEDKCMIGFDSIDDARAAFLACYNDPRFLGDVTPMPVAEFVAKVRATASKPQMIKAVFVTA